MYIDTTSKIVIMKLKAIKVIITGSTEMIGEGVLNICLESRAVKKILVINQKHCHIVHPKLKEIIQENFMDWTGLEEHWEDYNACFFCHNVSAEETTLSLKLATMLNSINQEMVFCYVSAVIRDRLWNDLINLPFQGIYIFRPGYMRPMKGLIHTQQFYNYIGWLYPIGRAVYPNAFCTLQELGESMISVATWGYTKKILEGKDIIQLAQLNA